LEEYKGRKFKYCSFKKKEMYCIDGFAKEGVSAIIILPPVYRNKFRFNGIKTAVLIL